MVKKKKTIKKSKGNNLKNIEQQLGKVLAVEKNILKEEHAVEEKENAIKKEEDKIGREESLLEKFEEKAERVEEKEETDIAKLEQLEKEIKDQIGEHPLAKITFRDLIKGLVGAFVGLAVHYTFTYGVEISTHLDITRTTMLYILSFIVGLLFIYATGFRKVTDPQILMFMPIRLLVLYVASIIMSIVILFIFYPHFGENLTEAYKMVGGVLLAGVVGACTADLIGKD